MILSVQSIDTPVHLWNENKMADWVLHIFLIIDGEKWSRFGDHKNFVVE